MRRITNRPKHEILGHLEKALDNNIDYIGDAVYTALHNAYEAMDSEVYQLQTEFDEALERIQVMEEQIEQLEG